MTRPQISSSFIQGFDQLLQEKGVSPGSFYRQAQLPPFRANSQEKLLPFHQELRLFEMAAKYFSQPEICLDLARRQDVFAMGPVTRSLLRDCSVKEALQLVQENLHLSVDSVSLRLDVNEDTAILSIHSADPSLQNNPFMQDHGLALLCIIMRTLCGIKWKPRSVFFQHPEHSDLKAYHDFFGAPLAFNHALTGIVFNASWLNGLAKVDEIQLMWADQPAPVNAEQNLPAHTRGVIAVLLSEDACNIENLADQLHMSKRTLQRRLQENETSFKDLVNCVRSEQALTYLRNRHYSLGDVAAMLGYSQLSAFSRSFKRWHQQSPQTWRKAHMH
ncbi:AraC family transcriptional regulator [Pseudomaricurvus alkylphenolicus]|uniref:AraC family transcriptional regulator n=1 Tax=Pseudomaricurvus alkylphenolicus TaxID=1306991 RepID=UPI00141DCB25|nr:AraC family transcriptional regulator [Pseudomaricurvus alkylphenolicus]NIB42867.1 AraC family transcriptional regulator [Pseudomaricurvus alkylphenolicus]